MKITKKNILIFCIISLFVTIAGLNTVYADVFGCCINPGAAAKTCSQNLVSQDQDCCPKPELSYPAYYTSSANPSSPTNYNDCITNFFFANKDCSLVSQCALGCCCSNLGGTIKPASQCVGTGLTFYRGNNNCAQLCPTPQCTDGIDNDNNGCADYGLDTGCTGPTDAIETGGSCLSQSANCNNANYIPKLSNFIITPQQGQKVFLLRWLDECSANTIYYDILRCQGQGCTNFALVSSTNTPLFQDASDVLIFDTTYTYQIKAHYSLQTAVSTITQTANLGNAECFGQTTSSLFCLNNTAYLCNAINQLSRRSQKCPATQFCVIQNNQPSCLSKINCNYNSANPFGLFYTMNGCENNRYCFYDRSHSTIDSCYSCDTTMSCYDYKTDGACNKDNCNVRNCKWKSIGTDIGAGVCVSKSEYNCKWCNSKGTPTLDNIKDFSFNNVFDFCTNEKLNALSEGAYKCYLSNSGVKDCNDVVCSDYAASQCSNTQIMHDQSNKITNPSNDDCGIKVCQNIGNVCVKNADGDSQPDCSDAICEKDYLTPNTTLISITSKGVIHQILIQIYDKTSANGSSTLKTAPDYSTFLCVEPCGAQGHPYNSFTRGRSLIISSLNVFDGSNGTQLLTLNNGNNVIRYYSQDPAKNIGEVKTINVNAQSNTSGPIIFVVNIIPGSKVLGELFTNSKNPNISVEFFEPAIITYARLINNRTNTIIPLPSNNQLSKTFNFSIMQQLQDDTYTFELNAKNTNNIFMDNVFSATIFVDTTLPELNITPSNGTTINTPTVTIRLQSNKRINLSSVKINSVEIMGNFTTTNQKTFAANLNLSDGNKQLDVIAADFASNPIRNTTDFVVDAQPTQITLLNPKFATSSSYTFNIVVGTDNDEVCRYSLDDNFEFDFMDPFTSTGSTTHTISNFNKIKNGDTNTHTLNVKCKDANNAISFNSFDINVDTTTPQLTNVYSFPNPIIEQPFITTLTIQANEPVICKYSSDFSNFDQMNGTFQGFDTNTFNLINRQNITVQSEGSFLYHVACENKAELHSDTSDVQFKADLTVPMAVVSHTQDFFNSTDVTLAIGTNKKSQCKYSETDTTAQTGNIIGPSGYSHTKALQVPTGKHTFYVVCKDQYLQKFSDVLPVTFTVDLTPPIMKYVDDTSTLASKSPPIPDKTCLTDRLRVKWIGEDTESNVKEYYYSLIKKSDDTVILNYTQSFKEDSWLWVDKLSLDDQSEYFFRVKSKNFVGFESDSKDSDGITIDTSLCKATPKCGDGIINLPDEECDGNTFGLIKRCTQYTNFIGGTLKCTSDCKLDSSGCTEKPKCGNSELDQGESCDSSYLGPLSGKCLDYNNLFTGGALKCNNCNLDTSGCQGQTGNCGDAKIDIGEACDGNVFGQIKSCTDYSEFSGGTLKCTTSCQLDTSGCTEKPKCGNNKLDTGELCDNNNFGNITDLSCNGYSGSFVQGQLACTNCKISTHACRSNATVVLTCADRGDCGLNEPCNDDAECDSRSCINKKCTAASCSDGTKNQDETGIDCGGECGKCQNDQKCKGNGDCKSSYCSFGICKDIDKCNDGLLSPSESDIDCGGSCPTKCQEGKSCTVKDDCGEGLKCMSSVCKKGGLEGEACSVNGLPDSDCDGMPDQWEIDHGLNPNDPSDANQDPDKDGLTNREEFDTQKTFQTSTDPNKADTDGDGFSDKEEIDKGTNPVDPKSFPKSNTGKIIMFIAGILVLISGFSYLAYRVVTKREENFEVPTQLSREVPKTTPQQQKIPSRQSQDDVRLREMLKQREKEKEVSRQKLFEAFSESKPKQESKVSLKKPEQKPQEIKKPSGKIKISRNPSEKIKKQSKAKEDVFVKLRQIAKESKRATSKNAKK